MATVCNNCASGLEENAVVCVHCSRAVNGEEFGAELPKNAPTTPEPGASVELPAQPQAYGSPIFSTNNDLAGIGGWLILVAVGLAVGPFFRLRGIVQDSQFLFTDRYQAAMSSRPGIETIILFELVTNSFFLVFLLLLNLLFYRKRRSFPTFMIFNLVLQFVAQLVDHLWALRFSQSEAWSLVLQTQIAAAIWIPYMLNSERVEQTFVN